MGLELAGGAASVYAADNAYAEMGQRWSLIPSPALSLLRPTHRTSSSALMVAASISANASHKVNLNDRARDCTLVRLGRCC